MIQADQSVKIIINRCLNTLNKILTGTVFGKLKIFKTITYLKYFKNINGQQTTQHMLPQHLTLKNQRRFMTALKYLSLKVLEFIEIPNKKQV